MLDLHRDHVEATFDPLPYDLNTANPDDLQGSQGLVEVIALKARPNSL